MIIKQKFTEPETEVKWYCDSIEEIVIVYVRIQKRAQRHSCLRLRLLHSTSTSTFSLNTLIGTVYRSGTQLPVIVVTFFVVLPWVRTRCCLLVLVGQHLFSHLWLLCIGYSLVEHSDSRGHIKNIHLHRCKHKTVKLKLTLTLTLTDTGRAVLTLMLGYRRLRNYKLKQKIHI